MKSNTITWIVGVVLIIGLLGWGLSRVLNKDSAEPTGAVTATTTNSTSTPPVSTGTKPAGSSATPVAPSGTSLETYTNSTYAFKISYPADLNAEPFNVFHRFNNNDWRINATTAKRGTPVISVPVIRYDNENAYKRNYPLYYGVDVRIGVSPDTTQCYSKDDGYTTQTITNVTINGVTWKKFIFGDAAMMQYVNGASYRTIRNNQCYVIEQVRIGSTYRDDTMGVKYTEKELDAFYARTTPIVMSFKFTK